MSVFSPKLLALGLAGAATLALGGCYDNGYGYGGVSAGAGYYGGGGDYGYGGPYGDYYGYDGFGYDGFGYPGYGWFNGFYYPGSGYYVFDRGGHRFHMRDGDWQHWHGQGQGQGQAGGWQGRQMYQRGGPGRGGAAQQGPGFHGQAAGAPQPAQSFGGGSRGVYHGGSGRSRGH